MQPNQQNSYDFIMNPQQKRANGPGLGGPQKLLAIVGLITVVVVVIVILFSVVFSGGSNNRTNLVSVTAHQTELVRVIELGLSDAIDQKLTQQFQTLLTTVSSDSQAISSLVATRDIEITGTERNAEKDSSVDSAFEEAVKKNEFDPVYEQTVAATASSYLRSLQAALADATSDQERRVLNTAIFNVQTVAQPSS